MHSPRYELQKINKDIADLNTYEQPLIGCGILFANRSHLHNQLLQIIFILREDTPDRIYFLLSQCDFLEIERQRHASSV